MVSVGPYLVFIEQEGLCFARAGVHSHPLFLHLVQDTKRHRPNFNGDPQRRVFVRNLPAVTALESGVCVTCPRQYSA